MVDVGAKEITERRATARASVRMAPATLRQVITASAKKGDVLAVARVAGIQAAKRTSELIPLCHTIGLTSCEVDFEEGRGGRLSIEARVRTRERTGVEMEALVAASVAALTVYDMIKGVDRGASIEAVHVREKRGGKSGTYERKS